MNEAEDRLPAVQPVSNNLRPELLSAAFGIVDHIPLPPDEYGHETKECHLHIDSRVECQEVWKRARTCMSTGPQEIDEGLELASGVFTRAVRSTVDAGFPKARVGCL